MAKWEKGNGGHDLKREEKERDLVMALNCWRGRDGTGSAKGVGGDWFLARAHPKWAWAPMRGGPCPLFNFQA
jgi:hypothetical protein